MTEQSSSPLAWFVTGTDTGVGKTFSAAALLLALAQRGIKAVGMKPVAAGLSADGLNDDVESLIAASAVKAPTDLVSPYRFEPPVAPHIAAAQAGRPIEIKPILRAFAALLDRAEAVVVEGVGGFCVPLSDTLSTVDLARALDLPVILVVGMRLGCINHALLTRDAIAAAGLPLAGWIANPIDPEMACFSENLDAIEHRIGAPLLGVFPPRGTPESAAQCLTLPNDKADAAFNQRAIDIPDARR